ncbi:MAG: LPS export ABC transporter periplasmic protein LptC [Sphingomonadales bacterium RIFCSPHIGHO2_01_FULL_65_20]|jgi:lipopolysaccharide export system protein LptC|uniref:LPS export ABC transporter periplasmic protein LptC n=1 Tax=Sphingomonas ursincola TaxID=56361 RepID=A0A7V8RDE6_9SPHN|nr:LPS export ABC transporter periplasmic protein LptC [Sphingomonas ursincola]MBA4780940.1 LPS export ABC transporter periplasmic protein LptC [Blastomonas sp.]OHC96519.1 MAG: LPS export ABC transporter periplasmic protein LptC [Sphingomonadales bacterium RIFCSPHIGHO2_01_FULL_65_20]MBA1374425.1 LPS export ABC transporter periplasmic protein LptC [Sphingomonas ursincola]MBY0619789.1 LPS export ABC transporter periplasmic protein LptC [Sphingomonas ursincola]MCH2239054.1 LPS export ABC transpor
MTQRADQMRSRRQLFAAPGSSHDKMVRFLGMFLPAAIGVLVAFLALAPLLRNTEVSFLLDKNQVDIARERMRVTQALYRGQDSEGRPFSLEAGSAVQKSSRNPVVEMNDLAARILLKDGPGVLEAGRGNYNMDTEQVEVVGPVQFSSANGYRMVTRDVDIDLPKRSMVSRGEVTGRLPTGTFRADRLKANLAERTVTLEGRARLRMTQGGLP